MKLITRKTLVLALASCMIFALAGCGGNKPGVAQIENNQKIDLAVTDYSQYCTLGEYKGIEYEKPTQYDFTEEQRKTQLQMAINEDFADLITETEITDRGAELSDTITITYKGTIDGESFDGSDSPDEGSTIVLGYAGYIEGFEDGIVGMKPGETKEINVTFPENSNQVSTDGKDAVFTVTLLHIYNYSLPELTDEMVDSHTDYKTYDEYYAALEKEFDESVNYSNKTEISNQLIETIVKNSTYNGFPEDEVLKLVDEAVNVANSRAESYQMDVETYISTYYSTPTMDDYKTYMKEQAEEYMKIKMAICEIARAEGLELTQQNIDDYKAYLTDYYALSAGDNISNYVSNEDIKFECLVAKVQDIMINNAKAK